MTANFKLHEPWPKLLLLVLITALALFGRMEAQEAKGQYDIGSSQLRLIPQGSWESQNTPAIVRLGDGTWDVGTALLRYSDKTLHNFYHEKFEYVDGELRILKPITVIDATPTITGGKIVSETYDGCNVTTCYEGGYCAVTTAYCTKMKVPPGEVAPPLMLPAQTMPAPAIADPLIGTTTPTICGMNIKGPNEISRFTELIQVTCPPWAALAAVGAIPVPAGKGPQTQVIVHAREGDTFTAEVDGMWKEAGVLRDLGWLGPGLKGGIIVFDDVGFTSLKIAIQTDLR